MQITAAIALPALAGCATLALPRSAVLPRVLLALAGMLGSFVLLLALSFGGALPVTVGVDWMPQIGLDWAFHLDGLSLFFSLLISGVGLMITLYGRGYFGHDAASIARFFPLLGFFASAMLGVVLADSFILLLLFWELTSISSFLLIGWERQDRSAVKKAEQAFIITAGGGLALTGGLILLQQVSGVWKFSQLTPELVTTASTAMTVAFALIFAGAAAKSAQWPLHFWLPGAMAAPTPVSAFLHSATMVKAGIYLMGRLQPTMAGFEYWPIVLIGFGATTLLVGSFMALRKTDLKICFAYATVSQLGLLMAMYGLGGLQYKGHPNLEWDITQIVSHAFYKAPLFILIGAIGHLTHTREVHELRGLARAGGLNTLLGVLLLVAAYAMAAGPGMLAFASKELFFYQVWHGFEAYQDVPAYRYAFMALIGTCVLAGAFNVTLFVRILRSFLSRRKEHDIDHPTHCRDEESPAHNVPHEHERGFWFAMIWVPAAVLLLGQVVGGLIPPLFGLLIAPLETNAYYFPHFPGLITLLHPSVPLAMSVSGIVLGTIIALLPVLRRRANDAHELLYPAFYALSVRGGGMVFKVVQGGSLSKYIAINVLVMTGLVLWAFNRVGLPSFANSDLTQPWDLQTGFFIALLLMVAAIALPIMKDRPIRVLILGTVGFAMAAVFYLFQAPDVALTQISVEIVSLVLFLLVLAILPVEKLAGKNPAIAGRLFVSVAGGAAIMLLILSASSAQRPQRPQTLANGQTPNDLGTFFLRNSYIGQDTAHASASLATPGTVDRGEMHLRLFEKHEPEHEEIKGGDAGAVPLAAEQADISTAPTLHKGGGGSNVVNVTLVDFRGFDTLGEITVLGLAALSVWTLLRKLPAQRLARSKADPSEPAKPLLSLSTPLLKTTSIVLVPTALAFGLYVLLKGHQEPGGGFVGGLICAVALLVHRMAWGERRMHRLLPIRERTLISVGLLLAGGTAVASLLVGLPVLTSTNGYAVVFGQTLHWATVAIFDIGVMLTVIGTVVGMISALSVEVEGHE